jgi:GntR family transcriptional regulator
MGELGPGEDLPSEAALVEQYGVARGTARQSFTDLDRAGRPHGDTAREGRFVRRRP